MQQRSGNVLNGYRVRKPKTSPLWQCLDQRFDGFLVGYEQRFQPRYGYLRPIIPKVRIQRASQPSGPAHRTRQPGAPRPVHHPQPVLRRKDANQPTRPVCVRRRTGRRLDPLPFRHEQEDSPQLRGLHPLDFIAAITQHIPDKSFQLVRYYGWYSNKMRGQRDKRVAEDAKTAVGNTVEVIDVSEHKPRRIPSAKWRELIKKVWEADPLLCPNCQCEMRIVGLIDDRKVIERILRHLGLWAQGVRVRPATGPPAHLPGERIIEPWLGDPSPDYDAEPIMAYATEWNHRERTGLHLFCHFSAKQAPVRVAGASACACSHADRCPSHPDRRINIVLSLDNPPPL